MDLRETYNRIAEDWHKDHRDDDWWKEGTSEFVKRLKPDASVLDVGCGTGTKAKHLVSRGLNVVGIDFSDGMIEIARREVPNAEFRVLDMRNLASLPGTFDAVFVQAAILHLQKAEVPEFFSACREKLRPGGLLYTAVKEVKPGRAEEEIVEENDYGYPYRRFFSYYALPELEKYFSNAGFGLCWKNSAQSGKTRWLQVVGKKH